MEKTQEQVLNIYSQSILFSSDISQVVCSTAACQLVNSNLAHGLEVFLVGRKLLAVRRQLDALKMSLAGSVCNPAHCPKTLYICFGFECKTDEHQPLSAFSPFCNVFTAAIMNIVALWDRGKAKGLILFATVCVQILWS